VRGLAILPAISAILNPSQPPPTCNPEAAHRAMSICQAWNISLRVGSKLKWNPEKERFDLEEGNRMLWREPRAPWRV
jgi:hypothetical protein